MYTSDTRTSLFHARIAKHKIAALTAMFLQLSNINF